MSLSMGQDKSRASSTGTSYQLGRSESQDFATSTSSSTSGGSSSSQQRIAFEDIFRQLYGGASTAATSALATAPELMSTARQLFTGGSQFLQSLGGGAGTDYMESRLTGENPVLDEQIAALREDTESLFTDQLNPAITSRAVAGGTLGGGRQGVAQGIAMEGLAREFTRGATDLRARDVQQRDSIAAQIANNSLMSASTGLGALPGLLDIMERGAGAELGIYGSLSSILGGPTVLGESESQQFGESESMSIAEAFAKSFQQGASNQRSSARSSSWDFGIGLINS